MLIVNCQLLIVNYTLWIPDKNNSYVSFIDN